MPAKTDGQWDTTFTFQTLPDYLRAGLDVVFIGINPGLFSVARGHYFARSTSRFWPALSRSRLSEAMRSALSATVLLPEHDSRLPQFGFGLTDVVKTPSANAAALKPHDFRYWAPQLVSKLLHYAPRIACFHGLTAYRPFLKLALEDLKADPKLGAQPQSIGKTRVFVAPNPSPANAHFTVSDQADWYDRLADFLDYIH